MADFRWNERTNKFDVTAYGEEEPAFPGFVLVEVGSFTMGSPPSELGRGPRDETQHEVLLTRDFYLSEMEVTQAQWIEVMGSNPSWWYDCAVPNDDCPVDYVSWYSAVDYCNALSTLEGLDPAYEVDNTNVSWDRTANGYRLPTEAEWEYACRAGNYTAFYNGPITDTSCDDPNLERIGWYCGNNTPYNTKEVGQKVPNALGLYDMSGNVFEWCWDWYDFYPRNAVTDPIGPDRGQVRVIRGGGFNDGASRCRSAYRYDESPRDARNNLGLRLAKWAP